MRFSVTQRFEFDWDVALVAGVVFIIVGAVGNFVLMRPSMLGYGAILGGIAAAFRSGYYDAASNSAVVGVLLGAIVLTPPVAFTRVTISGVTGTTEQLFMSLAMGLGFLPIFLMIFIPVAYLSAAGTDFVRRRTPRPIGY